MIASLFLPFELVNYLIIYEIIILITWLVLTFTSSALEGIILLRM